LVHLLIKPELEAAEGHVLQQVADAKKAFYDKQKKSNEVSSLLVGAVKTHWCQAE
jgi:hypothetical protein